MLWGWDESSRKQSYRARIHPLGFQSRPCSHSTFWRSLSGRSDDVGTPETQIQIKIRPGDKTLFYQHFDKVQSQMAPFALKCWVLLSFCLQGIYLAMRHLRSSLLHLWSYHSRPALPDWRLCWCRWCRRHWGTPRSTDAGHSSGGWQTDGFLERRRTEHMRSAQHNGESPGLGCIHKVRNSRTAYIGLLIQDHSEYDYIDRGDLILD